MTLTQLVINFGPAPASSYWYATALYNGREVGRVEYVEHAPEGPASVMEVSVATDMRRQGIATALLDALLARYGRPLYATAPEDNGADTRAFFAAFRRHAGRGAIAYIR